MNKKARALLLIGIIGIVTSGSQFAAKYGAAMWGEKEKWWTPLSLASPLHETANDFELFLSGELLQSHLDRGSLHAADKAGETYRVVSQDVKVRLNNWNKTKASRLHHAVLPAFLLGASLAFLILGVAALATGRKKTGEQGAP